MTNQLINNFLQYLVSPALTVGIMWFILEKVYKFGELTQQFKHLQEDVHQLKLDMKALTKETERIVRHLHIIKTFLVSKHGLDANLFKE